MFFFMEDGEFAFYFGLLIIISLLARSWFFLGIVGVALAIALIVTSLAIGIYFLGFGWIIPPLVVLWKVYHNDNWSEKSYDRAALFFKVYFLVIGLIGLGAGLYSGCCGGNTGWDFCFIRGLL
jgi:hypothetical protein